MSDRLSGIELTELFSITQKVRFAEEIRRSPIKVETKDAEVWTHAPDHDHYLFVRMYCPTNMNQTEVKCSVTMGKQYFKTKRLDEEGKPPSGIIYYESSYKYYKIITSTLYHTIPTVNNLWREIF